MATSSISPVRAGTKRSIDHVYERPHYSPTSSADHSRESSPSVKTVRNFAKSPYKTELRQFSFEPDASILLIGISGTGKSSLGILAASAYNRRLVESDKVFADSTGLSHQAYRKTHGIEKYTARRDEILRRLLLAHDKNAVIVCSFSDLERRGVDMLMAFMKHHPVIHIKRDHHGLQKYWSRCDLDRTKAILVASTPILQACTNFEFFNLSEDQINEVEPHRVDQSNSNRTQSFMTLKRVERDFLKMLRNVIGDHEREQSHRSAYPLSSFAPHLRHYSLAANITVDEVLDPSTDLDEVQVGVDAIEMVVEPGDGASASLLRISHAFSVLRRTTILPIIVTVNPSRSESMNRTFNGSLDLEVYTVDFCLRLAPEYCTIDLSIEPTSLHTLLNAKGRTLIIGKRALLTRPPEGWQDPQILKEYEAAQNLRCELFKITMPGHSLRDGLAVQAFRHMISAKISGPSVICYNTGRKGKSSIYHNTVLTPVWTARQREAAGSDISAVCVTAKAIYQALFATSIYEPMHFFIYGGNVDYSLSPAMHNASYAACGMRHHFDIRTATDLEYLKELCARPDFGGCAVVQPFKIEVLPLLAGLSSHARAIGSVNTVIPVRELNEDSSLPSEFDLLANLNRQGPVKALYGQNTDWIGIRACLRRGLSPANAVRANSTGLVCGAGGQARATVYAMLSLGVRNIFICNRTVSHAQKIADHFNTLVQSRGISEVDATNAAQTRIHVLDSLDAPWPRSKFRFPTMIVSGIPTQRRDGSSIQFRLREDWLSSPSGGVVCELAYRPMVTPIVQQMRERSSQGWILMDGFDVLPEQAFAQFELFTGRRAPRKIMRQQVIQHYRAEQERADLKGKNLDPNPPAL